MSRERIQVKTENGKCFDLIDVEDDGQFYVGDRRVIIDRVYRTAPYTERLEYKIGENGTEDEGCRELSSKQVISDIVSGMAEKNLERQANGVLLWDLQKIAVRESLLSQNDWIETGINFTATLQFCNFRFRNAKKKRQV